MKSKQNGRKEENQEKMEKESITGKKGCSSCTTPTAQPLRAHRSTSEKAHERAMT